MCGGESFEILLLLLLILFKLLKVKTWYKKIQSSFPLLPETSFPFPVIGFIFIFLLVSINHHHPSPSSTFHQAHHSITLLLHFPLSLFFSLPHRSPLLLLILLD